nr:unnamed protein product [Callosobruchus chinensis]
MFDAELSKFKLR